MRHYYYYIVSTFTALVLSIGIYAVNTNAERLVKLRLLADYDFTFDTDVTSDSIIAWEKTLEPELEKKQQYDLLFQLKMMVVQALITQGNISLAINNSNLMYQRAKEMQYPLGIALALRAMGDTYLSSTTPQASIEAYDEALKMMLNIPQTDTYIKSVLSKLIIIKLNTNQLKGVTDDLKLLESICNRTPDSPNSIFLLYCNAYYYITIGNLHKAMEYMQQSKDYCDKHPYPYYRLMVNFLYSRYHIESKEYALALKEYDKLLQEAKFTGSYRHVQMLQERARILSLMGKDKEVCLAYDTINAYKDSLNAQSYSCQINELHTLYQIDQSEINNQSKQKMILYWSISIVLLILLLIIFFIIRIKRENKHLFNSQQEQEKTKKQAENSIRTKSLFLSNMSHEIRTPLNALSGFSSILTDESIDNETRKQCNDIIQQNSELLLKLINDVIDLSSLEIGKMTFKFETCDAVALCKNVISMVQKIKQTNADVLLSTPLHSLELVTDNARLQQLLINLLINATKFTSQGVITLALEQQTEDMVLFSVTDTGCGIPIEKQNKIFNRFEKLNENAQGTGLGLAICQLIVEQLGGRIWIDPDYADGARFIFTHPIRHNQQREEETK